MTGLALLILSALMASPADDDKKTEDKPKLPADILAIMKAPDEMVLYSLKPLRGMRKERLAWGDKEKFHSDGVVGKVALKEAKEREQIVDTILQSIDPREGNSGAGCFWPHHGVRFKKGDKTIDMSICFNCSWLYVFDGDKTEEIIIYDWYRLGRVFDVILTRHGVKLEE